MTFVVDTVVLLFLAVVFLAAIVEIMVQIFFRRSAYDNKALRQRCALEPLESPETAAAVPGKDRAPDDLVHRVPDPSDLHQDPAC